MVGGGPAAGIRAFLPTSASKPPCTYMSVIAGKRRAWRIESYERPPHGPSGAATGRGKDTRALQRAESIRRPLDVKVRPVDCYRVRESTLVLARTPIKILMATLLLTGCSGAGNRDRDRGDDGGWDLGIVEVGHADVPEPIEQRFFSGRDDAQLDVLFVIDDSSGMDAQQQRLAARIPEFVATLAKRAPGLPDLHLAVVSSSLGAGRFDNLPGCLPGTSGNREGLFQRPAACTQLHAGHSFLSSVPSGASRVTNFDGDLGAAAACLTRLGTGGCAFEQPFNAARVALERSANAGDPNEGFLRPEAHLAVVMVTNEDDCSVPADSDLFDPSHQSAADPYGGLRSYRCNEFGHRCNGVSPPHALPAGAPPMGLSGCVSAEDGKLVTVDGFVRFLRGLKPDRDRVVAAAITGPPAPYVVEAGEFVLAAGGLERQTAVVSSCTSSSFERGDPAVRIHQWVQTFVPLSAVFASICADDFRTAVVDIARTISRKLGNRCIEGAVLPGPDLTPDCAVSEQTRNPAGEPLLSSVPFCADDRRVTPCWEFKVDPGACPVGKEFQVCRTTICDQATEFPGGGDFVVSCSIAPAAP